jgi:hypothetical protein
MRSLATLTRLILKVLLEDIPRHGGRLADELRKVGAEIKKQAVKELAEYYPPDPDGATPIAYLWARTVKCESPNCGAEIPLLRSFWLCKKVSRLRALRAKIRKDNTPQIELEVFEPRDEKDVPAGTVTRAKATCIACERVLAPDRVRAQLREQRGGADTIFDAKGNRTGGARLTAVVMLKDDKAGRQYRIATDLDYGNAWKAQKAVVGLVKTKLPNGISQIPDEPLPAQGTLGFRVQLYGMTQWGDLFTARQKVALATIARITKGTNDTRSLAAVNLSHITERNNSLCRWYPDPYMETVGTVYGRQVLPIVWDFAEAMPLVDSSGGWDHSLGFVVRAVETTSRSVVRAGQVQVGDAADHSLPDATAHVWFTDPPYYDAVPYADLSDFFYVWLRRALPDNPLMREPLTPKDHEIVQDETKRFDSRLKDRAFFEERMALAFTEGRRVLKDDGVGAVVFAHKTTAGWEALLSGMIKGGWTITGSWPVATELGSRLRARESAALATSVHLICRPRSEKADIGDWGEIFKQLPNRIGDWIERLSAEGVRGADLVFACIGPAMELYSRHSKVEDAEGREIPLGGDPEAVEPYKRGFLSYVWETVGRIALEQILGTAEARARNGAAGALEEDARLTALFLWTIQSTAMNGAGTSSDGEVESEDEDEDASAGKSKTGLTLVYDVARRFAQPLGIHLDRWEHRIIVIEKGIVRLLPVMERVEQLLGEDGAIGAADLIERTKGRNINYEFAFAGEVDERPSKPKAKTRKGGASATRDEAPAPKQGSTTLDRIHIAMLLQKSGKSNALRTMVKSEIERGADFLRLANALSALYPKESEEKRLLDAMLLAAPR